MHLNLIAYFRCKEEENWELLIKRWRWLLQTETEENDLQLMTSRRNSKLRLLLVLQLVTGAKRSIDIFMGHNYVHE